MMPFDEFRKKLLEHRLDDGSDGALIAAYWMSHGYAMASQEQDQMVAASKFCVSIHELLSGKGHQFAEKAGFK